MWEKKTQRSVSLCCSWSWSWSWWTTNNAAQPLRFRRPRQGLPHNAGCSVESKWPANHFMEHSIARRVRRALVLLQNVSNSNFKYNSLYPTTVQQYNRGGALVQGILKNKTKHDDIYGDLSFRLVLMYYQ